MDIHRLEVFCRVVDLQSFTKAAEASYLTQPTVSEHIRALEEALDEKLVDRLGREVLPTPAGKILYRYARNIIALRDEAIQALDRYKGKLSGHLLIGASTIPGTFSPRSSAPSKPSILPSRSP
jgi:DNA-binding transcriptional LysR family regulator